MSATASRETLAREIGVAAAVTNTELSTPAVIAMVEDLSGYSLDAAVHAIRRARRECGPGRFCLAAIIERIEHGDGHPGADEAWAMCPLSEADSVVWTDEMARAYAIAQPLIATDRVGARMAFKDAYSREVDAARLERRPIQWRVSFGTDPMRREMALQQAVLQQRITVERARELLPAPSTEAGGKATQLLTFDDATLRQRWAEIARMLQMRQAESAKSR